MRHGGERCRQLPGEATAGVMLTLAGITPQHSRMHASASLPGNQADRAAAQLAFLVLLCEVLVLLCEVHEPHCVQDISEVTGVLVWHWSPAPLWGCQSASRCFAELCCAVQSHVEQLHLQSGSCCGTRLPLMVGFTRLLHAAAP